MLAQELANLNNFIKLHNLYVNEVHILPGIGMPMPGIPGIIIPGGMAPGGGMAAPFFITPFYNCSVLRKEEQEESKQQNMFIFLSSRKCCGYETLQFIPTHEIQMLRTTPSKRKKESVFDEPLSAVVEASPHLLLPPVKRYTIDK